MHLRSFMLDRYCGGEQCQRQCRIADRFEQLDLFSGQCGGLASCALKYVSMIGPDIAIASDR